MYNYELYTKILEVNLFAQGEGRGGMGRGKDLKVCRKFY